jgi:hypothetical protein
MRFFCVLFVALVCAACGGTSALFRQYEYEEEMYLSLDGSATLHVNSSISALNALRGTAFDTRRNARVDRGEVQRYFTSPVTRVVRVTPFRRSGRQFVHVRIEVDDIRRLSEAPPFAWSSYSLDRDGEIVVYEHTVTGASRDSVESESERARWTGDELVAFRVHIPSVVVDYKPGEDNLERGNIVVWEQPLGERLKGTPLVLEARMESESILYRTISLFGAMAALAGLMFAFIVWRVVRRGKAAS